jgi:hypothetical protein
MDLKDLCISGTEARQIAEVTLFETWMERLPYEINLHSPYYALLDPTDVVDFVFENIVYQERLKAVTIGQNFALKTTGVSQLPTAYASAVPGAPSAPVIVTVAYGLLLDDGGGYMTLDDGSHILIST